MSHTVTSVATRVTCSQSGFIVSLQYCLDLKVCFLSGVRTRSKTLEDKKNNNYLNQRLVERYEAPCGRFIMNYNNIFLHLPIKNMSSYLIKTDVSDDFPPNNKIPDFSEALGFISLQHT